MGEEGKNGVGTSRPERNEAHGTIRNEVRSRLFLWALTSVRGLSSLSVGVFAALSSSHTIFIPQFTSVSLLLPLDNVHLIR